MRHNTCDRDPKDSPHREIDIAIPHQCPNIFRFIYPIRLAHYFAANIEDVSYISNIRDIIPFGRGKLGEVVVRSVLKSESTGFIFHAGVTDAVVSWKMYNTACLD